MKKIFAAALTICMLISNVGLESSANCSSSMTIEEAAIRDEQICNLLDEVMEIKLNATDENISVMSNSDNTRLQEINEQLETLGVEQVAAPGNVELSSPYVITPTSNVNDWYQWTSSSVLYDGERYDVTTLRAQPKASGSKLLENSNKTIHEAPGIAASACDYLWMYASSGGDIIQGIVSSVYDILSPAISAMSRSTVIDDISATYFWQARTIMYFRYVKPTGSSEDPTLCYIDNSVNTKVFIVTSDITYNGTSVTLGYESDEFNEYYNVSGSDVIEKAISEYINSYGIPETEFVDSVKIYGTDGTRVVTISICDETVPALVE